MTRLKLIVVALITLPLLLATFLNSATATAGAAAQDFDPAAVYKAKCAMCHGPQADKKFDATKADEALADVILKGKDDVMPKMPAYEAKGITAEQAKALVAHMKSLKQ